MASQFLRNLRKEVRDYYSVIEPDFPEWLEEYIETSEMLAQQHISMTCGACYSKLFGIEYFYSSLEHSIGVALIVWHFTRNKKQTLSGLFHDIATPAFKHCVDFMNGDYLKQESTEELTTAIISESSEIMALLRRDGIEVSEVDNYHLYPIADNDTPQLSADRLEYSMSNLLFTYTGMQLGGKFRNLASVKRFYKDLVVAQNANGEEELAFKHKTVAEDFVKVTSGLSVIYRDDRTRFSMQLMADIFKSLSADGMLSQADLYRLKERDVIEIVEKSEYAEVWRKWREAREVTVSDTEPVGVYYVRQASKVRYIDPLVTGSVRGGPQTGGSKIRTLESATGQTVDESRRISVLSKAAARAIAQNLGYKMDSYVTLGFEFTPKV